MGVIETALGAGISALGGLFGATSSVKGQELANAANAKQAQLNRDFQERMSNTAYQRAVADMQAAGLNPALAYQQGGSSTPTGATAQITNTRGQAAGIAANSAASVGTMLQQFANIRYTDAQTRALNSQAAATLAETQARTQLALQQTGKTSQEGLRLQWENQIFPQDTMKRWAQMTADLGLTNAQARQIMALARMTEAGLPAARNQSAIDQTWYGRNIRPFINDAGKVKRTIFD